MQEKHYILRKRDSIVISSSIFLDRQKFWDQMLHLFSLSHNRKYDLVDLSFFRSESVPETTSSNWIWTPTRGYWALEHLALHRFLKPEGVTDLMAFTMRVAGLVLISSLKFTESWNTLGLGSFHFFKQANEQNPNTKVFCRKHAFFFNEEFHFSVLTGKAQFHIQPIVCNSMWETETHPDFLLHF